MTDNPGRPSGLQWKWVWISLAMFIVFYLAPIMGASTIRGLLSDTIIGGWSFGGIIVISALAGFLSKGVTIWEPAIAGGILTILLYCVILAISATRGLPANLDISSMIVALIAIFGLSLIGAGLGEGIQNVSRGSKTEDVKTID